MNFNETASNYKSSPMETKTNLSRVCQSCLAASRRKRGISIFRHPPASTDLQYSRDLNLVSARYTFRSVIKRFYSFLFIHSGFAHGADHNHYVPFKWLINLNLHFVHIVNLQNELYTLCDCMATHVRTTTEGKPRLPLVWMWIVFYERESINKKPRNGILFRFICCGLYFQHSQPCKPTSLCAGYMSPKPTLDCMQQTEPR